jgi:hypothetical protein
MAEFTVRIQASIDKEGAADTGPRKSGCSQSGRQSDCPTAQKRISEIGTLPCRSRNKALVIGPSGVPSRTWNQ